jgi:hypothetical protein
VAALFEIFVFDTSAYMNAWKYHYPPETFPPVWRLIETAMGDGRVISPREVYRELVRQDDELARWTKDRRTTFVDPSETVQRDAGAIYATLPNPGIRDAADPWVIAEAKLRGLTVVTYEGRSFGGGATRRWHRQMPGICAHHDVACLTLPEALSQLGGPF